jgi:hypothetical protein
MDTFFQLLAMVCVYESYLCGDVFAGLFPRNAYVTQYVPPSVLQIRT